MNIERLAQWLGIVANMGVLGGFLLVAYQLQLNTSALKTASLHKTVELFSNSEVAMMGDTAHIAYTKAILEPENIEPHEVLQVWAYSSLAYHSAFQVFQDYETGIVDDSSWFYAKEIFLSYINHPIGLIWWETLSEGVTGGQSARFKKAINGALEQKPEMQTQQDFKEIMRRVRELKESAGGA